MNKQKKKFWLVINNEGNHYEGCYATFDDALKHSKRRKNDLKHKLHLLAANAFEIDADYLTKQSMDHIVEGEGTESLWEKAGS